jgi:hypothetical protein
VTPQWADEDATRPTVFDHMGILTAPFQIKNGYQVEYDANGNPNEIWGDANRSITALSARRRQRLATKL